MDFGALPPEINSGRLHTGPGSASMSDAAAAWAALAADVHAAANAYSSTLSDLAATWRGPSAVRMAATATPYVAWMYRTAAQAAQTADQAKAAVDAYETARTGVVPPTAVAANRSELALAVATNTFGQNVPRIATLEAQYAQMWSQDAAVMYTYAASAAATSYLTPFNTPPTTSSTITERHDATAQVLNMSASDVHSILSQLSAPLSGAPPTLGPAGSPGAAVPQWMLPLLNTLSPSSPLSLSAEVLGAGLRGISVGSVGVVNIIFGLNLSMLWMQAAMSPPAIAAAFTPGLAALTTELNSTAGEMLPIVSAKIGGATLVGKLSTPPNWAVATPTMKLVASGLQGASAAAPAATGQSAESLIGQMLLSGFAGSAVGSATPAAVTVTSVRKADMARKKDDPNPSKFDRVVAELSENPDSVQHWHTDKAELEGLLEQLSKKPGTHAVHVRMGGDKKRTAALPESMS